MTNPGTAHCPSWAIAVFASRESQETLALTVRSAIRACSGRPVVVDLVINGNPVLAGNIGTQIDTAVVDYRGDLQIRVWEIGAADKANAWNRYVHEMWPSADVNFFVDGYARVEPAALSVLAEALRNSGEDIWAVTGMPTRGRSADTMRAAMARDHDLHGNLYALPRRVMIALRNRAFWLPFGLYRTDGFLGAALKFALDPVKDEWKLGRVMVCASAAWTHEPLASHSFRDLLTHFRRRLRQAQGRLENAAVRQHWSVERNGISTLPETWQILVTSWARCFPVAALVVCIRHPLCWIRLRTAFRSVTKPAPLLIPRLVTQFSTNRVQYPPQT